MKVLKRFVSASLKFDVDFPFCKRISRLGNTQNETSTAATATAFGAHISTIHSIFRAFCCSMSFTTFMFRLYLTSSTVFLFHWNRFFV